MKRNVQASVLVRLSGRAICLSVVLMGLGGCLVPPMANMQSARTLESGESRIVPYATSVQATHEGDSEKIGNAYGVLLGSGGNRGEFQFRYDRVDFIDDDGGYNFLSVGPKIGAVKDIFAILIPVGFYWGAFSTVQLHPGVVVSAPVSKHVEINTAAKLVYPLHPEMHKWGVVNLGVGLSTDIRRWAVLPEVGFAWDLSDNDVNSFFTFGVAVVFYSL